MRSPGSGWQHSPRRYAIPSVRPLIEIGFFESAIEKFSRVEVKQLFELGAGTAPYLEEWHRRGYAYCGLDLSPEMIEFAREKGRRLGIGGSNPSPGTQVLVAKWITRRPPKAETAGSSPAEDA